MNARDKKIRDYLTGDCLEVEPLVVDFSPYISAICQNFPASLSDEDIEEIAADVVVTVWRNLPRLNADRRMSPYIAGITRNLLRKKCRELKPTETLSNYEDTLVSQENIEIQYIEKEKRKSLLRQAEKLRKDDQYILLQYYYEEKSIPQIAADLHCSEARIKSHLFRIRRKLKKYLEEEDDTYGE